MQDTPLTILRSAARFFSGTMLSRITGMMRDIAMAYAFGTQSSVAALLVAFRFAHLLRRLFGEGALQTAFIPHFEELRKDSPLRAGAFFRDLGISLSLFLTILIVMIAIVLGSVYAFAGLSTGNAEIVWLTLLMIPSLLFICLFGINASLLQCEKSYFAPSAAPVAFNFIWIMGVFCVSSLSIDAAMSWLAGFVVIACLAQWAVTLPRTCSILKSYGIGSLWKQTRYYSSDVFSLTKPLALGIVGIAASQINNALDAVFARWASDEGPAVLWYAIRLQQLPLALFGIAISGALLPPLARAVKSGDLPKFRLFLDFAMKRSLALMLPITAGLLITGDSCINLIYGRGDFTSASTIETTWALWGYTIGLIPMALILVLAPAFYAQGNYRTTTIASVAAMVMNIGLNAAMIAGLGLGAGSVALATSLSAWFNLTWLGVALSKQQGPILSPSLLRSTSKIVLASAAAMVATAAVDVVVWGNASAIDMAMGRPILYDTHLVVQLLHVGINTCIFAITLAAAAFLLKADELTSFASTKSLIT